MNEAFTLQAILSRILTIFTMYYNDEQKLLINTTLILAFILTVVAFIIASILVFLICSHEIGAVEK